MSLRIRRPSQQSVVARLDRVLPKRRDRIVLHSVPDLEDSIVALVDELLARGKRPVLLFDDGEQMEEALRRRWPARRVSGVAKTSPRGLLAYLTARFVFTTHGLFGSPPPPEGKVVTNIWHGEPPCKPIGRFDGRPRMQPTFGVVCSTLGRAYRAAEFGITPTQVLITGCARNDRMLRADGPAVRTALDLPSTDLWVWLPTYRTAVRGRQRTDSSSVFAGLPYSRSQLDELDRQLVQQGQTLVLKPHPFAVQKIAQAEFQAIKVVTDAALRAAQVTLYELLGASDGLVTDISSVWVDYLLLDRPMVFAFPDIVEYRDNRGINIEPYEEWIPGPLTLTVDELVKAMSPGGPCFDAEHADERRRMLRRLHAYADDRSAARLLDAVGL